MKSFLTSTMTAMALAVTLAGCSSDGGLLGSSLTTSSVDSAKVAPAVAKVDPACLALTAKIDGLRKDGVTERAEKAAVGKTSTVSVKRDSLAKLSELDKANFEYQTKCSAPGLAKPMPAPAAAAIVPATKVSTAAPAAKKAVAAKATATLAAPVAISAPAAAPVATAAAAVAPAPAAAPAAAMAAPAAAPAPPAASN